MRKSILNYLPQELARELSEKSEFDHAEELRIRAEKRTMFYAGGREYILSYTPNMQTVRKLIFAFSEHSVTAFFDELKQGFFTVGKGVRIGVAGRVVSENGIVKMIRDYTSVNIRFPQELIGISRGIAPYVQRAGKLLSTLIVSAPQHGKTTLLRDMIRAVSNGEGYTAQKCAVVDERSEISGGMRFDLGLRTDVLLGCPKAEGMSMALRSLSPQVIATDEIGGDRERESIFEAAVSGVKILATAHASSFEELQQREYFAQLFRRGIVERVILLSESLGRGTVEQICDAAGRRLITAPLSIRAGSESC